MASSISAGDRLGWTSSLPRAGWKNHYSRGRKSLKTWRKKWQELDEKALIAIQLCLTDEVLDEFLMEKTVSSLWEWLHDHYLKKSLANWLILKQHLFLLGMHWSTPI